jgi:hypothetical protein
MLSDSDGNLPLPMQLLPQGVLKGVSEAINQILVNFGVASSQKGGATLKHHEFQLKRTTSLKRCVMDCSVDFVMSSDRIAHDAQGVSIGVNVGVDFLATRASQTVIGVRKCHKQQVRRG